MKSPLLFLFVVDTELGSCGNPWIDIDHLLRQDWNPDPEPYDRGPHVVRQPHHRSRHH